MANKVCLTDAEVGTKFGTTHQWVVSKNNAKFPQPVKADRPLVRWAL